MTALPARNLLGDATSPYLLQHKDNPVHWRPWSAEALAEAKALDKPILLSTGYSACHWCHVMAHESFEDQSTADLLNASFVCIKVDREERPEIDQTFQTALQALGQQGGWPLTVFLTPDGKAFGGGTYFPAVESNGRPAFSKVVSDIAAAWTDRRAEIEDTATKVREALVRLWGTDEPRQINPAVIEVVSRRITQRIDLFFGGFEGAPKFPQTHALTFVWRAFMRSALGPFGQAIGLTLDNMSQGGIYDHLGGGFARYATDERWLVPHFEKMLYDNASMVELLTLVWQHTRSPLYAARVDETVDWLLREMVTNDGAFAAALDADSEGAEGRFYVWSEAEIDEVLGPNDAPLFKQVYGVTPQGNWEGQNILHRLGAMGFLRPDQEAVLTRCRRMLLMARAKRVRPARDNKALADWNGMAIAALAQAGAVFRKPEWQLAAIRAFWAIDAKLGDGDKLHQSWCDGRSLNEATAEGYAQMSRAALILHELTMDKRYLDKAVAWMERVEDKFADSARGGYFLSSADATDVDVRIKTAYDAATPNYNGVLIEVLARLAFLTGDEKYRKRSNGAVVAFGAEIERNPTGAASLLNAMEFIFAAVQIVIIGDERSPETQALIRAVFDRSLPARILTVLRPGEKLPKSHPAHGKGLEGGKATAYVCSATTCSPPVTDPAQLFAGLIAEPFRRLAQMQAEAVAQQQQRMAAANNR
ncbi:MAG: thioredoxin domain-containing protein [Alphaproteobacteria bacterium]|nr:thioredoxin domain-containing protein [Alphaproteobacteria bacterium]